MSCVYRYKQLIPMHQLVRVNSDPVVPFQVATRISLMAVDVSNGFAVLRLPSIPTQPIEPCAEH